MNKKNLIPLLILIVLIVIFLIIKMNDRTEKRIRFFDLDTLKIAVVEITSPADTLTLEKIEGNWMITYPVKYEPNRTKVKDLFGKALTVETSNIPVSESETSFETYGLVDSVGTVVRLYDANRKLLDESIINKSSNYNYAYARKYNNDKIYQLLTNVTYHLNPAVSPWRNKEILNIDQELISSIEVAYSDTLYTLSVTDTLWNYRQADMVLPVHDENAALKGILNNVSGLRASSFVDGEFDEHAAAFEEPALILKVSTFDGDVYDLIFAAYEDNKYLVQKNGGTENLYVIFEYLVNLFKKNGEDFAAVQ